MGNAFTDATAATSALGLCTLAQVKERVGQVRSDEDDDRIVSLIEAVTPLVSIRYGREFMPQGSAERVFPVTNGHVSLGAFDLRAATTVTLDKGGSREKLLTPGTDYVVLPLGSDPLTNTYSFVRLSNALSIASDTADRFGYTALTIEGTWGIWASVAEVPANIRDAAVTIVLANLDRSVGQVSMLTDYNPRDSAPATPTTWDIPFAAHRKFMPYSREMGVW